MLLELDPQQRQESGAVALAPDGASSLKGGLLAAVNAGAHLPYGAAPSSWYLPVRVALEFLAGLVLFIFFGPVMLVIAAIVKLTSRGPAFYSQIRVGRYGRPFKIYKIRTMIHNCESSSGPQWSTPGDPRVTRVGNFLRKSHLDELPQLINVLRGEMSLIGPRPERPEFLPQLEQAIANYRHRLVVRPGVTGLAQVQLPPDTDLNSVRRKLAYDLYYIRNLSPWLDMRIVLCTSFYVLGMPFEWSRKLFRVPPSAIVEADARAPTLEVAFHRVGV